VNPPATTHHLQTTNYKLRPFIFHLSAITYQLYPSDDSPHRPNLLWSYSFCKQCMLTLRMARLGCSMKAWSAQQSTR